MRLMGPRLIGVAAVQINFLVTTNLASFMIGGSVSSLSYAWQIFTMPQVVIAQGIAIAALPTFSAMASRGEIGAGRTARPWPAAPGTGFRAACRPGWRAWR